MIYKKIANFRKFIDTWKVKDGYKVFFFIQCLVRLKVH